MARIAGVNIPMNKHVWVGLTHIFGVGRTQAQKACDAAGVKRETKVKDLTDAEVTALRAQISRLIWALSAVTSASVRSLTLVSRLTPAASQAFWAWVRPTPKM